MDKQTLINLERCIQTAKDAGVPRDQAARFINSGYIPYPWQWRFHAAAREADLENGPVDIGAGGARGPGKSHAVLSQASLDDCQRVPKLKGLFLRQTGIAAQESFEDLVDKVVVGHIPHTKSGSVLKFPNGSRILLGGFQDENDIDKYVGIEYDFIIVEELNQLTEDKYTKLRGSLRSSKPNWRPRMYTSFNPGGIGHEFVKQRYVLPLRKKEQKQTRFFPATYRDNPRQSKEYIEYLEGLIGDLGKMWRDGDFDIFAGQAFSEFSRVKHAMKSFIPSLSFEHFLSIDWGWTDKKPHSFAAYLHAIIKMKLPDGQNFHRVITYREWAGNTKTPNQWAEIIYNDCVAMGVKPIRGDCDNAMFDPSSDYGKSISKLFMDKWKELHKDHWVTLTKCSKNRIGRKATVHNWLSMAPDGLSYWMITENCYWLLETLPALITDKNNPEDINTDGPDDPYDSTGYFLYKIKFISVKAGTLAYKTSAIPIRVQFTKDGQQIPFQVQDFAEQYKK
jgi:phage terminase large subunit